MPSIFVNLVHGGNQITHSIHTWFSAVFHSFHDEFFSMIELVTKSESVLIAEISTKNFGCIQAVVASLNKVVESLDKLTLFHQQFSLHDRIGIISRAFTRIVILQPGFH